jgi:hypothetical protein
VYPERSEGAQGDTMRHFRLMLIGWAFMVARHLPNV